MPDQTLILDTECYRNIWYLGIKRREDGFRAHFEFSARSDFDRDRVRRILKRNKSIGFNSLNYDMPMIYLALEGASNEELKNASNKLITESIPHWRASEEIGVTVPKIDHIDLFETNPSVKRGLKLLNGSMHMKRLQELPFEHERILTYPEMDALIEYCQYGDLDGTEKLFDLMDEPIALRELMAKLYGTMDLRSKSDAQVGETVIKTQVSQRTGKPVYRAEIKTGTTFRYKVPDWMKFETPYMQMVLKTIAETDFQIGASGKVDFPKEFSAFNIVFDGMRYALGIGGLHSTESNRAVHSDDEHVLIDADVASQYPNIIMKLGLYPEALGKDFLHVYKSIIDRRLEAKRAKDKATDKGLKISINGSYGKLGSPYSVLFAPHLMIAVTLTGQLSLLMLIEKASREGIPVVSGNTDGVVFRCPRSKFNGFVLKDGKPTDRLAPSPIQDIIDWWEGVTSFNLEFAEYRSIYNESVNTYMAIKADGGFKRKGSLANHWRAELPWGGKNTDYDPSREGLKKSPSMTILSDAVLGLILHGIPIERTIRECTDVREFVTVVTATGGATWREEYLGKVVRYYWAKDGDPIIKVKAHAKTGNRPKVSKTDGCRPLMTLPDDYAVPADLDYDRYIAEAYEILRNIGYTGPEVQRATSTKKSMTRWQALLISRLRFNTRLNKVAM